MLTYHDFSIDYLKKTWSETYSVFQEWHNITISVSYKYLEYVLTYKWSLQLYIVIFIMF